jgi:hypothetical protein
VKFSAYIILSDCPINTNIQIITLYIHHPLSQALGSASLFKLLESIILTTLNLLSNCIAAKSPNNVHALLKRHRLPIAYRQTAK